MAPLRVEIWSDLICPWCGLGNHRLNQALERFGHTGEVELVHRSYQLDESTPEGETKPVREMLSSKLRMAPAQIAAITGRVEGLARADGLSPYIVLENRVGNTSLAHELAAWATEQGKGDEMWRLLYTKYFGRAESIFEVDSLVPLASELGLDPESARQALESRRYQKQVLAEGREAQALGSNGVPFIVVDRRYAVAGAQSVDVMLETLETAWRERAPGLTPVGVGSDEGVCGPDGCA
jgi:predicted DsbA family dithiol-disulfide isomerase